MFKLAFLEMFKTSNADRYLQVYLLQKEKGLLETSRSGWEAQERVLRVKIQHREEQLDGGEVRIKNIFGCVETILMVIIFIR